VQDLRESKQKVIRYRSDEDGQLGAAGHVGREHKRLGKVMVCFELNYCGSEQFQMTCPSSDSNHCSSKMAEIN
jgi:hypothetical protein